MCHNVIDPGPPTNIVLTQIGCRRVQVTWTPPAGFPEATYHVYVNRDFVNINGIEVTENSYATNSLLVNFNVTIQVRATTGTYLSVPAISDTLTIRGKVILTLVEL